MKKFIEIWEEIKTLTTETNDSAARAEKEAARLDFVADPKNAAARDEWKKALDKYAAIWNTNVDARTVNGLRFEGVAINAAGDPVGIFTEYDENENEKNTVFLTIQEFYKMEARPK